MTNDFIIIHILSFAFWNICFVWESI